MWGSTEKIAHSLMEGIEETDIPVTIRNLKNSHISDIITDVLSSKMILLGSPTLNNSILPTMGSFITYLKGLRPKDRIGFVFGSYGWGGQAVGEIEKILKDLSWDMPIESININYIPDKEELINVRKIGIKLGNYLENK
jgi:flavorubredoxin